MRDREEIIRDLQQAKAEYDDARAEGAAIRAKLGEVRSARRQVREELLDTLSVMREAGATYRDLGDILGVTPQRVCQMLTRRSAA